jgi:hypothetical protein
LLALLPVCAASFALAVPLAFGDDAARARHAYASMERTYFDPRSGDYRDTTGRPTGSSAWPFSQALAATLEVARLEGPGASIHRALRYRFAMLDRRFRAGELYAASPHGYVYYDDNDWIALDLLAWNNLHANRSAVRRAARVFDGVAAAWASGTASICPGGVPWTAAPGNQDRNTVTTANAAVLGLQLYLLSHRQFFLQWSVRMLAWLDQCLLAPDTLFWDHIAADGTIDETEWSYNQGSVMDAYRLLYLATRDPANLSRAEAIANATLAAFKSRWADEPPEFAAIFFSRLLHLATLDGRSDYVAAAQGYADQLWSRPRARLLEQAAVVQLYAALAIAQPAGRGTQPH